MSTAAALVLRISGRDDPPKTIKMAISWKPMLVLMPREVQMADEAVIGI